MGYNYSMDYQETVLIYQSLDTRIRQISDFRVKKDLLRMLKTCENIKRELACETVNSRAGLNHRVLDLRNKFSESVTSLDQYVTLALLTL